MPFGCEKGSQYHQSEVLLVTVQLTVDPLPPKLTLKLLVDGIDHKH